MNIKLSSKVRKTMKEQKIITMTCRYAKLNLLVIGSDLPFPVFIIRQNRKEVLKTYDFYDALCTFKNYSYGLVDRFNELPLQS